MDNEREGREVIRRVFGLGELRQVAERFAAQLTENTEGRNSRIRAEHIVDKIATCLGDEGLFMHGGEFNCYPGRASSQCHELLVCLCYSPLSRPISSIIKIQTFSLKNLKNCNYCAAGGLMIAFGLLRRNVVKGWISVDKLVVNCLSSFPSAYPHVP